MQLQTNTAKLGEVKYRQKIVKQHLGETVHFPSEPTAKQFNQIVKNKLKETEKTFRKLQKRNIKLSPYLEIGSEHCLRPALLESKFKAKGFATDISLYSLMEAPRFARIFKFKKTPQAILADAYNLPFKSNSFPFIFIYETLHHFPNPKPVLEEIKRVLAPGGACLIGADPIKQAFQIQFWRRPTKLRDWEKLLKATLLLPFISHIGKTEVEHGIIETAFSLKTWQDALSVFDKVEVTMKAFPWGPTESVKKTQKENWISPSLKTKLALYLFGGGLQALCFKTGSSQIKIRSLSDTLICPNCKVSEKQENVIKKEKATFICPKCKSVYKKYHGVLVLLESSLRNLLLGNLKK